LINLAMNSNEKLLRDAGELGEDCDGAYVEKSGKQLLFLTKCELKFSQARKKLFNG
jgi:hypothetical protein